MWGGMALAKIWDRECVCVCVGGGGVRGEGSSPACIRVAVGQKHKIYLRWASLKVSYPHHIIL